MEIDKEVCRKYRKSPKGMAVRAWYRITARAENKNGKDACYANVKVKMTRDEFLNWAVPKYTEWIAQHGNDTPSINRINSKGHYELGNIEIISCSMNSRLIRKYDFNEDKFLKYIVNTCVFQHIDPQKVIDLLQKIKL